MADGPPHAEPAAAAGPVLEEALAVLCMALLVPITLANVLTRCFTDHSFAWTQEISIFLMVAMALAGASAAAARDRHIRIEFFYDQGSAVRQRRIEVAAASASALLFGRMLADDVKYGETTMGLGVPRWWQTVFWPVLCAAIAVRCLGWRAL